MLEYKESYINGCWQSTSANSKVVLNDSANGQPMAEVTLGDSRDASAAAAAAQRALENWSRTSISERCRLLRRVSENLALKADILAEQISREVGMPLKLSKRIQVLSPTQAWNVYADLAERFKFEYTNGHSLIAKVPVGVVACITPWNYPLHQITAKVAAALAAGCTVVLKPSELAPASAYALSTAIDAAGFPAGVFNMVVGDGPTVGEALVTSPAVDMVSFTGSTAAGSRVAALAATQVKRVALELGGKSACVVLPDADVPAAMKYALAACFLNSGQTCTAMSRLLVPENMYDQCLKYLREGITNYAMGNPLDATTRLGPLVSAEQRDRVRSLIEAAVREGARIEADGGVVPEGEGYFVSPVVLGGVLPAHTVAQEEVFGPVLSLITYKNEEEAIEIANGTRYGLAAAVWSSNPERALSVARKIRAGQIDINGAPFNPTAPFGGFKMSGLGRENGEMGLEEFVEPVSIQQHV